MKKLLPRKKEGEIRKYTQEQLKQLKDHTNYQKLEKMNDQDIDYSDLPETDALFWATVKVQDLGPKKAISLRVDLEVLEWFKQQEGRYQQLMNQVLRQYMKAHNR